MFKWAKEQKIYDAGFAKGLMFGKAVATRDERERVVRLLEAWINDDNADFSETLEAVKKGEDD